MSLSTTLPCRTWSRGSAPLGSSELWLLQRNSHVSITQCYSVKVEYCYNDALCGFVPSSLSASMLSCSSFRPRLVTEENCQLRTSDSWDHFAAGGERKNFRFWGWGGNFINNGEQERGWNTDILNNMYKQYPAWAHLGLGGQHVVPEDGGPAAGQLTDVRDDHHRQRHGLQQPQHLSDSNTNNITTSDKFVSSGLTSSLMSSPDWLSCSSDSKLSEWSSSVTIRGPWTHTQTHTTRSVRSITFESSRHEEQANITDTETARWSSRLVPRLFGCRRLSALSVAAWRKRTTRWDQQLFFFTH